MAYIMEYIQLYTEEVVTWASFLVVIALTVFFGVKKSGLYKAALCGVLLTSLVHLHLAMCWMYQNMFVGCILGGLVILMLLVEKSVKQFMFSLFMCILTGAESTYLALWFQTPNHLLHWVNPYASFHYAGTTFVAMWNIRIFCIVMFCVTILALGITCFLSDQAHRNNIAA